MKHATFEVACAQGDIHATKIAKLPKGLKPVEPKNGCIVVTHSETGHDHVMGSRHVTMYESGDNPLVCFLLVSEEAGAGGVLLEHKRPHDTHQAIAFKPGFYEVRRQREYVPEGFRRVED